MRALCYSALFHALHRSAYAFSAGPVARSAKPEATHILNRRQVECPEQVGAAPWACSVSTCGGEDSRNPGHCLHGDYGGLKCQCTNSGSPAAPQTTVVTTVDGNGAPLTMTYAMETVSSLTSLREAVTTTLSMTTTATDGSTGVETAAAIILAGGAAWFLAGFLGDAAAASRAQPPEDPTRKDDPTCPKPRAKCSDCNAIAQMCTTGPSPGCACTSQSCPSDKPTCSDCAGVNGKCTTGDSSNCDCTAADACPVDDDTLYCSDCGGGGANSDPTSCKGLANQNNKYQNCFCQPKIDMMGFSDSPEIVSATQLQNVFGHLQNWDGTYARPADVAAVCQNAGWSAPQRDSDGSPSVASSIMKWCLSMDGKTVTKAPKGVDTVFQMWNVAYYSYFLSASNWYYAPAENGCGDVATISKDECVDALTYAMNTCDPSSGASHGGSYVGKCISYNITLDGEANPNNPPWNRQSAAKGGICDQTKASDVTNAFWKGIFPQFCSHVKQNPTAQLTMDLTQNDFVDPTNQVSKKRTPPPSKGSYPPEYGHDWTFHFDWTGGNGCQQSCNDALQALAQSPCGGTGGSLSNMAASGSIDAGCGTYSYSITEPDQDETTCAVDPSFYENNAAATFTLDDATDAINKFCSDNLASVTEPQLPKPTFLQNALTDAAKSPYPRRYYKYGDTTIDIWAAFADTVGYNNAGCAPDKNFTVKADTSECQTVLLKSVNRCNTKTTTAKTGSFTMQHKGNNGCVVWQIAATK